METCGSNTLYYSCAVWPWPSHLPSLNLLLRQRRENKEDLSAKEESLHPEIQ